MSIPVEDLVRLEDATEKLQTALNRGDISALSDLFSSSAVILPPARNQAKGNSILEFLRNMALRNEGIRLLSKEMESFGDDLIRDLGTLSLRMKRERGDRIFYKYMMLWQKVGSEWKLSALMWNRALEGRNPGQAGGQATGEM